MQGVVLKGSCSGQEANLAFDRAAERVDKQLRRYTRRLKDRKTSGANGHVVDDLDAAYTVFTADAEEPSADNPLVVAETRVDIPEASVSDAVMMLDRSEEHTSELQSLMRISYAVFCLKTKNNITKE